MCSPISKCQSRKRVSYSLTGIVKTTQGKIPSLLLLHRYLIAKAAELTGYCATTKSRNKTPLQRFCFCLFVYSIVQEYGASSGIQEVNVRHDMSSDGIAVDRLQPTTNCTYKQSNLGSLKRNVYSKPLEIFSRVRNSVCAKND